MRLPPNPYEPPRCTDVPVLAELVDDEELPALRAAHRALMAALLGVGGLFATEGYLRGQAERMATGAGLAVAAFVTAKEGDWKEIFGKYVA